MKPIIKITTKIFKKIKYFLLLSFFGISGAIIILYPLYNRLLRDKLPRSLPMDLWNEEAYFIVALYVCFVIFWFYVLVKNTRIILYEFYKIGNKPKESLIAFKLKDLYMCCIRAFHNILESCFPDAFLQRFYHNFMTPFVLMLMRMIDTRFKMVIFMLILKFLPRFVMLICFFIDIVLLKQFKFIYIFSVLLIIPMILRYIFYWIRLFTINNIEDINEHVYLNLNDGFVNAGNVMEFVNKLRDVEFQRSVTNIHYHINTFFALKNDVIGYELAIEPNFEADTLLLYGLDFDYEGFLETCHYNITLKVIPIILFKNFYKFCTNKLLMFSTTFFAFFYTILWCYLIVLSI